LVGKLPSPRRYAVLGTIAGPPATRHISYKSACLRPLRRHPATSGWKGLGETRGRVVHHLRETAIPLAWFVEPNRKGIIFGRPRMNCSGAARILAAGGSGLAFGDICARKTRKSGLEQRLVEALVNHAWSKAKNSSASPATTSSLRSMQACFFRIWPRNEGVEAGLGGILMKS
jgi:hypothetical protein